MQQETTTKTEDQVRKTIQERKSEDMNGTRTTAIQRTDAEEVPELSLEDGTSKIFLNMTSKNGRSELISLLQYMKHTTLDNENVTVKDERILDYRRRLYT